MARVAGRLSNAFLSRGQRYKNDDRFVSPVQTPHGMSEYHSQREVLDAPVQEAVLDVYSSRIYSHTVALADRQQPKIGLAESHVIGFLKRSGTQI